MNTPTAGCNGRAKLLQSTDSCVYVYVYVCVRVCVCVRARARVCVCEMMYTHERSYLTILLLA